MIDSAFCRSMGTKAGSSPITSNPPSDSSRSSSRRAAVGSIVGGIVGGIAGFILIGTALHLFQRRRRSLSSGDVTYPQYGGRSLNEYLGNSRTERPSTILPFLLSTSVIPPRNNRPLQGKYSRLNSSRSDTQIAIDEENTGVRSLTSKLRRDDSDRVDSEPTPSALAAMMLNRERVLRDEMENLRREVQMIRHGEGIETDSIAAPPTYRDDL